MRASDQCGCESGRVFALLLLLPACPKLAMRIPSRIGVAARSGANNYVLAQLAPYNVNGQVERAALGMTPYAPTLLACCAAGRTSHGVIDLNHVDLARALIDRGADPNLRDVMRTTPLIIACRGRGEGSPAMVALLLDAGGADVNLYNLNDITPLVAAINGFYYSADPRQQLNCREIVHLLLRAGALPRGYDVSNLNFGYIEGNLRRFAEADSQFSPEHYLATKRLILDVQAAGSPRAYRMLRRKQVLLLRSLALKGRAEPRDARMTFLVESPNEIVWKVLEYWRTELDC